MSVLSERLKRIGPVVKYYQKKHPRTGTCFHCGLPWMVVKYHVVNVSSRVGFFTCCEYCWQRMTDLEKIDSVIALSHKLEKCSVGRPYTQEEMLDALARELQEKEA